jgi:hypothetical protein
MYTTLFLLLVCLGSPGLSWASLGDPETSVLADQQRLQAQLSTTTTPDYTVQQLEAPDGTVVREYVSSSDGIVFGVAWRGSKVPDLTQLLGTYFPLYQAALQPSVHRRGPVVVQTDALVVEMGGHMRAFSGRAYIPTLVPPSVELQVIQ